MAQFHFDNLAKNLPDAYRKDSKSNNFKILEIERRANNEMRRTLEEIAEMFDIDKATGATLDLYGKRFGQPRGKATDAQYRLMIKSKIVRGLSSGSYKDIVDSICYTFDCDKSEVLMIDGEAPASVRVERAPLGAVMKAGFSAKQAEQIVASLLPVTVTLEHISLDGTFEFAEGEGEYDEARGFAATEDSTVGGYFGWTEMDEDTDVLPI